MDRKMILSVLGIALFGFIGFMLLIPESSDDGVVRLPWVVTKDPQGHTRVFGFTLGVTSLEEVREVFGEEGKTNLFARLDAGEGDAKYAVEAYFEQIYLNRLRASFVISLAIDQVTLDEMFQRGLRISQLGSGAKKVELVPGDITALLQAPVRSITYLPWKSLDAEIIQRRFGTPAEKRVEPKTLVTHWLYPEKGMDVALDTDGAVVVQYVDSAAFGDIIRPLAEAEKAASNP